MNSIKYAVFPVAGLGTRFLPATKVTPKEMLPLVDKPLIQFAVEEALAAGVRTMVFITSRYKREIEDYFDSAMELEHELAEHGKTELLATVQAILPSDVQCVFVRQGKALGLGHAVLCAHRVVGDNDFAVILPDDFIDRPDGDGALSQMVRLRAQHGIASVLAVTEIDRQASDQYGIMAGQRLDERSHRVRQLVEKPAPAHAPSNLAVVGRYILSAQIFDYLAQGVVGVGGEIQLTDAIDALAKAQPVLAYQYHGTRYDCGRKAGYMEANLRMALRHPETKAHMVQTMATIMKEQYSDDE